MVPDETNYNGFKLNSGKVSILTFNQPRVNIFSTDILNDFICVLKMLGQSRDIKVLVITGEGNTFIAGADIKEMAAYSPDDAEKFSKLFHRAMNMVENFSRPVIAAANGFALGGGCELTLACDLVVASDEAVFGQPEINLGIIPGAGGTQRLRNRVGKLKAKEMIFTGRKISADEALSMGLVNRVVSHDKLFDEAMVLAEDMASKPLLCLEVTKNLINSGSMDKEIKEFSRMFSSYDQKRLMNKFIKK
ncbi:MAG: enoyl-CoA hydratase/isomerase family protein [Candidatus Scalindua sp.]